MYWPGGSERIFRLKELRPDLPLSLSLAFLTKIVQRLPCLAFARQRPRTFRPATSRLIVTETFAGSDELKLSVSLPDREIFTRTREIDGPGAVTTCVRVDLDGA